MNGADDRRSGYRSGYGGGALTAEDRKTILKQKIFRRSRRSLYVLVGLGIVAPIVGFFIMYQIVKVPNPSVVAATLNQPVTIYYADKTTVMTTIGTGQNGHQLIQPSDLKNLTNAVHGVEAAEDETFQTNAGVDLKAILRTVRNQATGGTGGASTITQEYIKQATNPGFLGALPVSTKVAEIVKAYKMSRTVPKDQVMTSYLNIVYFGRGAYGIGAAAETYYGITPQQLSAPQAALLAGLIQSPGRANSLSYQQKRFTYVMGQMANNHWLSAADKSATLPPTIPASSTGANSLPWDRQLIVAQVKQELTGTDGLDMDTLQREGAKVYTTIQPTAQQAAEASVQKVMTNDAAYTSGGPLVVNGKPVVVDGKQVLATEDAALVSADPQTGEIIAWYGGDDPKATQYDMAATPHQPGSSFKPYVFAGALETDPSQVGLNAIYDGSDGQNINGHVVHNASGESANGPTTVKTAMTQSVNTVFYNMGIDEGIQNVQAAAYQAGIPRNLYGLAPLAKGNPYSPSLVDLNTQGQSTKVIEGGISIGQYPVRPVDQAQGYATLANYGNKIPLHFVSSVVNSEGGTLYTFATPAKPAFGSDPSTSQSIAHTVIDSMTDVASADKVALAGNRPVAAKTGTQGYNDPVTGKALGGADSDAWMVGFTPTVVTSVWFGHYDRPGPIYGNYNNAESPSQHGYSVYGHEDPAAIWKSYMDSVLGNSPAQQFATMTDINGLWDFMNKRPISQDQPQSQSSQPNNPAGGGGNNTSTTETTTETTTTETTTTTARCGFGCPGGGGPGGGGQPSLPGG